MTEATKQTDDSGESAPNARPDAPPDAPPNALPDALKDGPGDVSPDLSVDMPAGVGRRAMLGVELLVLVLLSAWLLWAASVLQVEYFDGYETICNTRFFTGDNYFYQRTRAPVMALAFVPAEWCRTQLQMHSLDMRPYHFLMAIYQIVYLIATYLAVVKIAGRHWATLLAWVATVPTYIFFDYAAFLSIDILPGALFIWMLYLANSYLRSPKYRTLIFLVVLGTIAPLIKQTFGLFWVAIVIASIVHCLLMYGDEKRPSWRSIAWLAGGTVFSGALTWIVLAMMISTDSSMAQVAWLRRPWNVIVDVMAQGNTTHFPLWIYIRNFPAYGLLTTLLIVPGLVMALIPRRPRRPRRPDRPGRAGAGDGPDGGDAGDGAYRLPAISWLVLFLVLHVISMREVRYMAFLAPVSACLIALPLRWLWNYRFAWLVPTAVWLAGALLVYPIPAEAFRFNQPFYRSSPARQFFAPVEHDGKLRAPVLTKLSPMYSFLPPSYTPLAGDKYNRIFHFGVHHLSILYGYDHRKSFIVIPPDLQIQRLKRIWPDGAVLIQTNRLIQNADTWRAKVPPGKYELLQILAIFETLEIQYTAESNYRLKVAESQEPLSFSFVWDKDAKQVRIASAELTQLLANRWINPTLVAGPDSKLYVLRSVGETELAVLGLDAVPDSNLKLRIRGFAIKRWHDHRGHQPEASSPAVPNRSSTH